MMFCNFRKFALAFAVLAITGLSVAAVHADTIRANAGFSANDFPPNDDGSVPFVGIGFSANYFGTTYTDLAVNNNGNVTFPGSATLGTYTPFGLAPGVGIPIIAPFFADVDTRGGPPGLDTTYGTDVVSGHSAFGVNWLDVGYYGGHVDKLNSFQLVLIDRSDIASGDFDIEFNYRQIQWETGDASGGSGGLGGVSAHAGFSNGTGDPGTFFELPGSGVNGAFLDGGPFAMIRTSNIGEPGRWLFTVRSGVVSTGDAPEPGSIILFGTGILGLCGYHWRRRKQQA